MHIIIEGNTNVAVAVAIAMQSDDHELIFISDDLDENNRESLDKRQINIIEGSILDESLQSSLDISKDTIFLAITKNDYQNLVLSRFVGKKFGITKVICRIRDQVLQSEINSNMGLFNISQLLTPELWIDEYLRKIIQHAGCLQVLNIHNGLVGIVGVKVSKTSSLVGKTIRQICEELSDIPMRVVAIYRARSSTMPISQAVVPAGDSFIHRGDDVFFVVPGKDENKYHYIETLITLARGQKTKNRHVMIAGGGLVGEGLAKLLEGEKFQVKIIEKSEARCEHLSRTLNEAIVLRGEASDHDLLESEFASQTDVFVAVTNDDETNFLSCLLAKKMGASHCIALINNEAYLELVEGYGIDVVVLPHKVTTSQVEAILSRSLAEITVLRRGAAEVIEIRLSDKSNAANVRVKDLHLEKLEASIGAIVRQDQYVNAIDEAMLLPKDCLTIFLTNNDRIHEIEKLIG